MTPGGSDSSVAVAAPPPDALVRDVGVLEPPLPHERRDILRDEAALLVDDLLVRVARGFGALEIAIGEGLAALSVGDRALRLGFSRIGDYAQMRLGIAPGTAQSIARLARNLRERPLLRDAVRAGIVSARKASVVLPVARGDDEARWVDAARSSTVRALEKAVKAARAASASSLPAPDEAWERVELPVGADARAKLDQALALAGKLLGADAPRWQRLEAVCQEYLAAHPVDLRPEDDAHESAFDTTAADWLDAAREALETETDCWAVLGRADPVSAPDVAACDGGDPFALDAELRRLTSMRDRWDGLLGHLAHLLLSLGLWRDLGFASVSHYAEERLGMGARMLQQRAALERRLLALPPLRAALRDGRVSYEQARLVARVADDVTVEDWIARSAATTCVAFRRELDAADDAQMCKSSELAIRLPRSTARLLSDAFRAARAVAGAFLSAEECLVRIAEEFIATWERGAPARRGRQRRILERDRGLCQVPGCSRAATHLHHVLYRAHGGGDDGWNLVSICAAHHLHGIHRGYVRVWGRAPDALRWELGVRPGAAPLVVIAAAAA